jgi:hypothetical protein
MREVELPNNALERTVDYRGPHPGCQALHAASGIVAGRSTRSLDGE